MEVEVFQDPVDPSRPFAVLVDSIEGVVRSFHRQCRDVEGLAAGRDGRDARGDEKANVAELTQFLHHRIDLLAARSLQIENGFCVIEDYHHLLR